MKSFLFDNKKLCGTYGVAFATALILAGSLPAAGSEIPANPETSGPGMTLPVDKNPKLAETSNKTNGKNLTDEESSYMKGTAMTGRYQFGSSANYDVSHLPLQPDFVFRDSSKIYSLYDGLVASHSSYVTKIDLDEEAGKEGALKPKELAEYGFYMYRFRPAYAPVGVNHKSPQIYNEIKVMIVTGTHDEPYSVATLFNMMRWICEDWKTDVNAEDMRFNVTFYIIPCGNPWAFSQPNAGGGGNVRTNYNGVDLNRNMPTKDWILRSKGKTYSGPTPGSEYESKVLVQQIDRIKPTVFIDFHNYGTDLQGHVFYTMTSGQDGHDICAEVLSKNSRTLKKLNADYPQDTETILGWMRDNNERGSREGYAYERGALSFVYECCPGYVWNGGKLGTGLKRGGDGILMRDNLISFSYFVLRVLHEISMREGMANGLSLPKYP